MKRRYFLNFFFQFATLGVFLPFFAIYMKDRGFSGTEISLIMMFFPMMQLLANPLYGIIADTRLSRVAIYRTALVGSICLFPGFYLADGFWQFALFIGAYAFFRLPSVSIVNASLLERLASLRADYGRLRLGGSIGFILFVNVAGWWTARHGIAHLPDVLLLGLVGHLLVGWGTPVNLQQERRPVQPGGWRNFYRNRAWLWFLGAVVFHRIAEGGYNIFFSAYVVDLGHSTADAGRLWAVAVSSEVLVLWLSPLIINRFRTDRIMLVCFCVAAGRWFLTAHVTGISQLAILQGLHGITFGLFYVSSVQWAHNNAPDGLTTTAQSVLTAIMFGMSGLIGMPLSGPLYDAGGGTLVFTVSGWLALTAAVVNVCTAAEHRGRSSHTPVSSH